MTQEQNRQASSIWKQRISKADEHFQSWERKFKCKLLKDYYKGFQWQPTNPESDDDWGYQPYVLNMFYSTMRVKRPSLLFRRPEYRFSPFPTDERWDPENAINAANTASDLVNTLISIPNVKFAKNIALAIEDTLAYFGIIETGYAADWIENPNAGRPILKSDYELNLDPSEVEYDEPEELPENERVFVKRIKPNRFRVGGNNHWDLEEHGWCGYYDYYRLDDLKANEEVFLTEQMEAASSSAVYDEWIEKTDEATQSNSLVKVWKIFDIRKKVSFYYAETYDCIITKEKKFKKLPLFVLKFVENDEEWYPIPLGFNWKPAQDEINEAKEQNRTHRRRSKRLWQYVDGDIEDEEIQKLNAAPDSTSIKVKAREALHPIQNPTTDQSLAVSLTMTKDDFNIISGTSSDQRGESDRTTATQATITAKFASLREEDERATVGDWLCEIGLEILHTAINQFTNKIPVSIGSTNEDFGQDAQMFSNNWNIIRAQDLSPYGYLAFVTVESLSPLTREDDKKKMMEFFAVIAQYPLITLHPTIVRQLAFSIGYKNEKVIQAVQQMALLQMMAKAQAGMQNLGGLGAGAENGNPPQPSNMAQNTAEQMVPPTSAEIENQIAQQGVPF